MPGQCRGTSSFHASTPAPSPSPWTRVQTKTEGEMENGKSSAGRSSSTNTLDESTVAKTWTGQDGCHSRNNNTRSLLLGK